MCRGSLRFILFLCILLPIISYSETYSMPSPGNDLVGENYYVKSQKGDTLASLGLRYGMSYHKISEANPKIRNPEALLPVGRKILIPAQVILPPFRKGIVINLAELRLYYFTPDGKTVMTFPVAVGRDGWRTPTIATAVAWKEKDPIWHVPTSIRDWTYDNTGEMLPDSVGPGSNNPLGPFALHLAEPIGYLIHGNNSSKSIGRYVSSGCIRMKNADITLLYSLVSVGTPVHVIHYPNMVGWQDGVLYQESQIPVDLPDDNNDLNQTSLEAAVDHAVGTKAAVINWDASNKVAQQHLGVPIPIGETAARAAADQNPPRSISLAEPEVSPTPSPNQQDVDNSQQIDSGSTQDEDDWNNEE